MRTGNDNLSIILFKSSEFGVDTIKSINLHPFGESFAGELAASSQEIKNGKSVLIPFAKKAPFQLKSSPFGFLREFA